MENTIQGDAGRGSVERVSAVVLLLLLLASKESLRLSLWLVLGRG